MGATGAILKLYFTNREIVDSVERYCSVMQMVLGLQVKIGRRRADLWTRPVSEERQEPLYDGRSIRLTSEEGVRLPSDRLYSVCQPVWTRRS